MGSWRGYNPSCFIFDLNWAHKPLKNYHSLIDGLTPLCNCGSDECVRQYLSSKGFERQYHQLSLQHSTAHEILQKATENHSWSARTYRIWIDQLARSLSDAILHFKPQLLILNGCLIRNPDLALVLSSVLSRYCPTDILPSILCLNYEGFDFAKGSVSMHITNYASLSTFTL